MAFVSQSLIFLVAVYHPPGGRWYGKKQVVSPQVVSTQLKVVSPQLKVVSPQP